MSVLDAIARILAERMVDCLIGGFAIALVTGLLLRVVGRQNSGTRFAAWFSALVAIAALGLFGPRRGNPVGTGPQITLPGSWALYLFAAWAALALAGLARVAYGVWQVRRLRQNSIDLENVDPRLKTLIEKTWAGKNAPPRISVSDTVRVPVAIGFFRPMIVLPTWTIEELSPAELDAIVLHELAHLGRHDHWTNLAQKILQALFFFHPAVWWIERQISLEREMACDDAVLEQVSNPRAYAECLVTVAEKSLVRRGLTLVQAAVSRARQTALRIASILDPCRDARRPGATRVWKPALVLVSSISLVCVATVEHAPRLIAFGETSVAPQAVAVDSSTSRFVQNGRTQAGRTNVVPAALRWNSNSAAPALKPAGAKHAPINKPQVPHLVRTKAKLAKPEQPMLVLTRAQQTAPPPQPVFVVMRSMQSDGMGSVVFSLTVWRVIVTPENKVPTGIAPKAI
jgi:Zn-dependent protease with chaperone function